MAISIICSNCNASYSVPPHLAGKTVTCKRCNALLDVPDERGYRAPVASGQSSYQRIVGKPNPIALEIIGVNTRLDGEFGTREIFQLLWGLRHVVLLIVLLIFWSHYASSRDTAQFAAPFFFFAGILVILAGWVQLMTISRNIAANLGAASAPLVSYIASSFVLIAGDFRAALPAIRTMFLGLVAFIAALALASQAGRIGYVLPLYLLPSFNSQQAPKEHTPLPTAAPGELFPTTAPRKAAPPPPPPPPPVDDKPLPPPEDVLPPPG
jgi:hypothetical protein